MPGEMDSSQSHRVLDMITLMIHLVIPVLAFLTVLTDSYLINHV
jgi:hypothetical protein